MRLSFRRGAGSQRTASRGQSVVEFALVLPLMVILLLAIVDFARIHTTAMSSRPPEKRPTLAPRSGRRNGTPPTRRSRSRKWKRGPASPRAPCLTTLGSIRAIGPQ